MHLIPSEPAGGSAVASLPGKTAPRLLHDILLLNPADNTSQTDVLADPPPLFDQPESTSQPSVTAVNACKHAYALKGLRSILPKLDYRPQPGSSFQLQALCKLCRTHLRVTLQYHVNGHRPCPNQDYPLHHFSPRTATLGSEYRFCCTAPDCRAEVGVRYRAPVISVHEVDLLANPDLLRARRDQATGQDTSRQEFVLATPVSVLWILRRYIRDALVPGTEVKRIPVLNRRFLVSFAGDCDELLTKLGFQRIVENEDEQFWALPRLEPLSPGITRDAHRELLEDWDMELQALIERFSSRDGDLNPDPGYLWLPVQLQMERLFSSQSYPKSLQSRRENNANAADHPYYAGLGAMRDFADSLILFSYDRQSDCDPMNAPYYYDCLHDLATGRQSEELQLRASMLESNGAVGHKAIVEAYRYLGLVPFGQMSDTAILDKFRSMMDDIGPSSRPRLRSMLKVLGVARHSSLLLDAASETIETYAQALSWLGAEASYPDDSVLTLFTAKTTDNPSTTSSARRAVQIIADERRSDMLQSWLATGEIKDPGMTVDEACQHLKIQLDNVEEDMLNLVFETARSDNPGWKTDKAIDTIVHAYKSSPSVPKHSPFAWPVGLTSHGNTCYLNSLLQYYFTIKPLRELTLNFDDHKHNLAEQGSKTVRVGARRVTPLEIRAYQKFVDDLKYLFQRMIVDPGPAVKPEADLVCRAFLKAEETEAPTTMQSRTGSPPANIGLEKDTSMLSSLPGDLEASTATQSPLTASSETLGGPDPDTVMAYSASDTNNLPPSPPASVTGADKSADNAMPPLPPRPVSTPMRQQTNLSKAEEAARQQQDVTEVMDEILFRLRCAIKSSGMDATEEQLDQFRDIFYIKLSEKTLGESGKVSSREEYTLNILLNIPNRATDIYSALDEVFELQTIDHGTKKLQQYKTIQTLPPILQVNIPRITYDRATGRGVKVEHKVHLEESLYLDRYVESEDEEVLGKRQQTWHWRQRLEVLQAQKDVINRSSAGLDGPSRLRLTAAFLKGILSCNEELASLGLPQQELDESVIADVEALSASQATQLSVIDDEIRALQGRISTQFADMQKLKYRLFAVFFHRGGYGHGHYWTDIRGFNDLQWRIYNDEKVDEIASETDIYDAETWQQGTPTYAVYVRDDIKDDMVETICRRGNEATQPAENGTGQKGDAVMQDVDDLAA